MELNQENKGLIKLGFKLRCMKIHVYIYIIHDVDVDIAGGGQDSGNSEFWIFMSWNPYKIENHNAH